MLMALEREGRSIGWEREDDERRAREASKAMEGLGISGVETGQLEEVKEVKEVKVEKVEEKDINVRPKAPSTALMGLSMLGSTPSALSECHLLDRSKLTLAHTQTSTEFISTRIITASSCTV